MRSKRNQVSIAFFSLENMSGGLGVLYLTGILGAFALIMYLLTDKLFAKPVDFAKQRRLEREAKRNSKGGSGGRKQD